MNVYVGDAKYKLTDTAAGVDPDLYQLLAYTTSLGVPEGVLIYADEGQQIPPGSVLVRHADKRLWAQRIDLSGSPDDIRREVHRVSEWILHRALTA